MKHANSVFFVSLYSVFNTTVDIKLKQWADNMLPKKCVEVSYGADSHLSVISKYIYL